MTEVFAELRYPNDRSRCLVFKADKKDDPDCIYAPKASPGVLAERSKFANFVIFLVGKVTELTCSSRCGIHQHVFVDLNVVRLVISGDSHIDGHDRWFGSG